MFILVCNEVDILENGCYDCKCLGIVCCDFYFFIVRMEVGEIGLCVFYKLRNRILNLCNFFVFLYFIYGDDFCVFWNMVGIFVFGEERGEILVW